MSSRWQDAIQVLGRLHRVDPQAVGLEGFGRPSEFYNRQIRTLSAVSASQAQATNVRMKQKVGQIPHFDEMVAFFSNPKTQPKDRSSLIHGDYKIDNLIFHAHESRVIGILE